MHALSLVAHLQGLEHANGTYASKRQVHQILVSVQVIRLSSRYLIHLHALRIGISHVYTRSCGSMRVMSLWARMAECVLKSHGDANRTANDAAATNDQCGAPKTGI
jgi:hypothetical protein